MKTINIYIGLLISIFLLSCNTDREPEGQLSSENFWKTPADAERALYGTYSYLNLSVYDAYEDAYADNSYAQYPWESVATRISGGNISDDLNVGYNYVGIRRFNYFLDNIDRVEMDENLKNRYKAEVKVLRANYYFQLISKFGNVPFFENYIDQPEEAKVEPTSEQEILSKIIEDIDESIQYLPDVPAEKSLLSKAAANVIKARIHLYYGQWAEAANASKSIIDNGQYELFEIDNVTANEYKDDYSKFVTFSNNADKEKFYKGLNSYQKLFYEENKANNEVILNSEHIEQNKNYISLYLLSDNAGGGWSSIVPTQELVNSYWTRSGEWFEAPTKETRAQNYNGGDYGDAFLEEFKNRDTRLYASILFPGNIWHELLGDGVFVWQNEGNASNTSKTGYNYKKMVDPNNNVYNKTNDYPVMRYAEVLLNYAEAKNEVSGPSDDIYDALDQIRDRVGMPAIDRNKYSDQVSLRKLIRNERRIELVNEGLRWLDIKRWKIADQVMHDIYAINGGLAQSRVWEDKFYKMPYPISAIDRNPNLKEYQTQKGY